MRIKTTFAAVLMVLASVWLVEAQQDGLIGRWSFDEGMGTNVLDSSGHGFNGFLEGAPLPVWTNGISGCALVFDGMQNQVTISTPEKNLNGQSGTTDCVSYVSLPLNNLSFSNGLTVSAWVKAPAGTSGEIVTKWSTNGLAAGSFMLSLTNGMPCFELRLNGAYRSVTGTLGSMNGQWHFVAGTYDGTQMSVYWDLMLVASQAVSGAVDTVDAPLQIGLLEGWVDEVRLYSQSLGAQEVGTLKNSPDLADMRFVVPGTRSTGVALGQQKRSGTPAQAIADGADELVAGSQVTKAEDPVKAFEDMEAEIETALKP